MLEAQASFDTCADLNICHIILCHMSHHFMSYVTSSYVICHIIVCHMFDTCADLKLACTYTCMLVLVGHVCHSVCH